MDLCNSNPSCSRVKCVGSYCLPLETISLLPFQFVCLLKFLFLPNVLTGISILCRIGVVGMDSFVLFLILEEKLWTFIEYMVLIEGLSNMAFLMLRYVPSILNLLRLSIMKTLNFVKCVFWDDHMIFMFYSVNVAYYIYWFLYFELSLASLA